MRIAYYFGGQLWYANKALDESPLAAITRSLKRRLGEDVTLWYSEREDNLETWLAEWFDSTADIFREEPVTYRTR